MVSEQKSNRKLSPIRANPPSGCEHLPDNALAAADHGSFQHFGRYMLLRRSSAQYFAPSAMARTIRLGTFDRLRAIQRRGTSNGGRSPFSPNCSINPGTDGFAGDQRAPRRLRRSGAAVCWLLYIDLSREFTRNAGGLQKAFLSNRCLPEGKLAGASDNRASQWRARYRNRHE